MIGIQRVNVNFSYKVRCYTDKNPEKNILKICHFLQNSDFFSRNKICFSQAAI